MADFQQQFRAAKLLVILALLPLASAHAECTDYAEHEYSSVGVNTPSSAIDVVATSTHAYVADGLSGVEVVDLTDPSNPTIVGHLNTPGTASSLDMEGSVLYLADRSSGLRVIDVQDPTAPYTLGTLSATAIAEVAVSGSIAYFTSNTNNSQSGLRVVDVSNPASLQLIGSLNTGGSCYGVAVAGGVVCVANGSAGLRVIDVTVPSSPMLLATVSGEARGVRIVGTTAYVAGGDAGLRVVDLTIPASPVVVGTLAVPGFANDLFVADSRAYVASDAGGLLEVDISNPAAPVALETMPTWGDAMAVHVDGLLACVAAKDAGLRVIDLENRPPSVGHLPIEPGAVAVALAGDIACVAVYGSPVGVRASLATIDIANPSAPLFLGSTPLEYEYVRGLARAGGYAYVSLTGDGGSELHVVNVADPMHPLLVGRTTLTPWAQVSGVAISGTSAFVAAGDVGLWIVNVANPASPSTRSRLAFSDYAMGVGAEDRYAYVLCKYGLRVVDAINPASPQLVASLDIPGYALGMLVDLGRAYICDSVGLQVVDLSNPLAPQIIGSLPGVVGYSIGREGNFLYLTSPTIGIQTVDIGHPEQPLLVGEANAMQKPSGAAANRDNVFIADESGLRVLPTQCPHSGVVSAPAFVEGLTTSPNPSRGSTTLRFRLQSDANARVSVFDATGRRVRSLIDEHLSAGEQSIDWDGANDAGRALSNGVYQMRVEANGETYSATTIRLR